MKPVLLLLLIDPALLTLAKFKPAFIPTCACKKNGAKRGKDHLRGEKGEKEKEREREEQLVARQKRYQQSREEQEESSRQLAQLVRTSRKELRN